MRQDREVQELDIIWLGLDRSVDSYWLKKLEEEYAVWYTDNIAECIKKLACTKIKVLITELVPSYRGADDRYMILNEPGGTMGMIFIDDIRSGRVETVYPFKIIVNTAVANSPALHQVTKELGSRNVFTPPYRDRFFLRVRQIIHPKTEFEKAEAKGNELKRYARIELDEIIDLVKAIGERSIFTPELIHSLRQIRQKLTSVAV